VTLGPGSDRLELYSDRLLTGTITVTDFQAGDSGDRLELNGWFSSALSGWDGIQNPFTAGYARLVEAGGSTLLQVDRDGGGNSYVTLLTLSGVSLFSLTAANLEGFDPVTKGTIGADEMRGSTAADLMHAGPGNDILLLQDGGEDTAYGGDGNDTIYFGTALSAGDVADGGAGRDAIVLQGNITVTLTDTNLVGIESLSIQSGANAKFGDTANNLYDFSVTMADGNVAAGVQLIVNASSLRAGEDFTFDGSAEHDGKFLVYGGFGVDTMKGGDGNDILFFEGGRWGPGDSVDGGAGRDALVISGGNGLTHIEFGAASLTNIESISLNNHLASDPTTRPSYELVLDNGNVTPSGTLILNGNSLTDPAQTVSFDGHAVTGGSLNLFAGAGNDTLMGGAGADLLYGAGGRDGLTGGAGADLFQYRSTSDSTLASADAILDFQSGADRIDLHFIDADTATAGDQAFHWIGSDAFTGAGAASAGELRAYALDGNWFVEGDTDGNGIADLVIQLTAPAAPVMQADFLL
jgi:Ca2+-binding RTX toxin-like protein